MQFVDAIFRFGHESGQVFAILPGVKGDSNPRTCRGYMANGQAADVDIVLAFAQSRPATVEERAALLAWLQQRYVVNIVSRSTRSHLIQRIRNETAR